MVIGRAVWTKAGMLIVEWGMDVVRPVVDQDADARGVLAEARPLTRVRKVVQCLCQPI